MFWALLPMSVRWLRRVVWVAPLALAACVTPISQAEHDFVQDYDGDGFRVGNDCDDYNPAVNPDAVEICNALDDDCDGFVDGPETDGATAWYRDADGDGHGEASTQVMDCFLEGHSPLGDDCDDSDDSVRGGCP